MICGNCGKKPQQQKCEYCGQDPFLRGTLNFRIDDDTVYDRYTGVTELMPFAKAVSAKSNDFDDAGNEVHTDFEKGFIRAETIAYDDYIALGGEQGARDAGKLRAEGKSYVVRDGDVLHFLFNT